MGCAGADRIILLWQLACFEIVLHKKHLFRMFPKRRWWIVCRKFTVPLNKSGCKSSLSQIRFELVVWALHQRSFSRECYNSIVLSTTFWISLHFVIERPRTIQRENCKVNGSLHTFLKVCANCRPKTFSFAMLHREKVPLSTYRLSLVKLLMFRQAHLPLNGTWLSDRASWKLI